MESQLSKREGAPEVLRLRGFLVTLVPRRSRRLALAAPRRAAVGQGAGRVVHAERHPHRGRLRRGGRRPKKAGEVLQPYSNSLPLDLA